MSYRALYIDTSVVNGQLLSGLNDDSILPLSGIPLYVGDAGLVLQIYLMTPLQIKNPSNPSNYSIIPTTGLTLEVFLDNGEFNTDVIYTQQVNWQTDEDNQFFYAFFPMNTAALETLLGSQTSATCYLHIGYLQNGLPTTVFLQQISVSCGIPNALAVVPAPLTPLSVQAADQRYVPMTGAPGEGFILTSPNGVQKMIHLVDVGAGDAQLQADPVL
jgi:hypothetical protein